MNKTSAFIFRIVCTCYLVFYSFTTFSQRFTRAAITLQGGINYCLTNTPYFPGLTGAVSLSYVPVRIFTLSIDGGAWLMQGVQSYPEINSKNYFNNEMFSLGGSVYLNLNKAFEVRPRRRSDFIWYLGYGIGKNFVHSGNNIGQNLTINYTYSNLYNYIGINIRQRLRRHKDLMYSVKYYKTQTYFTEVLPDKKSLSSYVSLTIGISGILTKYRRSRYVDWAPMYICPMLR